MSASQSISAPFTVPDTRSFASIVPGDDVVVLPAPSEGNSGVIEWEGGRYKATYAHGTWEREGPDNTEGGSRFQPSRPTIVVPNFIGCTVQGLYPEEGRTRVRGLREGAYKITHDTQRNESLIYVHNEKTGTRVAFPSEYDQSSDVAHLIIATPHEIMDVPLRSNQDELHLRYGRNSITGTLEKRKGQNSEVKWQPTIYGHEDGRVTEIRGEGDTSTAAGETDSGWIDQLGVD